MRLNSLKNAHGTNTRRKRVGRGPGSGLGKTCGRGHKGQRSRSGGYHKTGFEGGQMPLQRRLPKRGFRSRTIGTCVPVRLHELRNIDANVIDLVALKDAGIVPRTARRAKIILSGNLEKAVFIKGLAVTDGARSRIESVGGKVEN